MAHSLEDLARRPNALARHYARFRVAERLLLTGHSHQAWPDVGLEGQIEAWTDAAERVDEKWERAALKADRVRHGVAQWIGARPSQIALGVSTHELVVRFLSALPLRERPRLVTTDGEFHTLRRQLDRLSEERGIEVHKVSTTPASAIAGRLVAAVDERTSAVLASSVLFGNAHIVRGLDLVLARCRAAGAELLVDAYHQVNVVPMDLERDGLADAFVVGGGYKYAQLGEGVCFLRVPEGRQRLRPVVTGWFSEFARLADGGAPGVTYGEGPARWAGSTYDPTSHYRAARVFDFFESEGLTPAFLRRVSLHQVGRLAAGFDALNLDPALIGRDRSVAAEDRGGFLALRCADAEGIASRLRQRGVLTDVRGELLRLGPAPYLSDAQLEEALGILAEVVRAGGRTRSAG